MATQPQMIPSEAVEPVYWKRFQAEIAARVRDCNVVSATLLWLITRTGGPARVTVASASRPGDCVYCSFDTETGRITCLPGPAISAPARVFDWTGSTLRCGGVEYTVEAAAASVLDELVCDGGEDE